MFITSWHVTLIGEILCIFSEIDEPLDFNENMRTNIGINVVS